MASLEDVSVAAAVNIFTAFMFLVAFGLLRLQPLNDMVYFPKWYVKGTRSSPIKSRIFATKFINLDFKAYIRFLNWMPEALRMPETELINHAGLDSAVYIRIYLLGLKIFVPITALSLVVLLPVHWTGKALEHQTKVQYDDLDKLSISNVLPGSNRFFAHVALAYVFTFWTFYVLYREYKVVTDMRMNFIGSQTRRPDQFTVLVRNVPSDPDESVSEHVDHYFRVNHPDYYFTLQTVYNAHKLAKLVKKKKKYNNRLIYYQNKFERTSTKPVTKTGLWGIFGKKVDAMDYYITEIEKLSKEEALEREKVMNDPKAIVPAAFVSFRSRWGAAVCAQTQQSRNPTIWLTEWAPEPHDVYWKNLEIPYFKLTIRRLLMAIALFFLIFFYAIPVTFVQSLANLKNIEKVFPFLKPIIEVKRVKSFIQGYLPGILLKVFLLLVPKVIMNMSKIEGSISLSTLERKTASKFHLFLLVNVFLVSIIAGTALEQLDTFLHQSPTEIPKTVGVSIPMKATFFITYIMVDGWTWIAAETVRIFPLIMFHLKNTFLVKTEQDREKAMNPRTMNFSAKEPRIQLYFLLGLVYAVISPILLPFIIVFFAFAYLVFRHQTINVYDQKYDSGATFWPDVHRRIIISLVISQITLFGLLSTKRTARTVPFLLVLPVVTIWFHLFCKGRFESAFRRFPIEDAMVKDILERTTDPYFDLRAYLEDAYLHPVLKASESDSTSQSITDEENGDSVVATKRNSKLGSGRTWSKSDPGV